MRRRGCEAAGNEGVGSKGQDICGLGDGVCGWARGRRCEGRGGMSKATRESVGGWGGRRIAVNSKERVGVGGGDGRVRGCGLSLTSMYNNSPNLSVYILTGA